MVVEYVVLNARCSNCGHVEEVEMSRCRGHYFAYDCSKCGYQNTRDEEQVLNFVA